MSAPSAEPSSAPRRSGVRTFLFWGLAVVWFSEMLFLGVPALSRVWTRLWQVVPPEHPQVATALSMIWASAAPAKGALGVMAVLGLRSRDPFARSALFASMALVPPLNIAFQFRYQGFLPGPVTVATVLSTILWGSFFLFRESARRWEQPASGGPGRLPSSRWELARSAWFAAYSAVLTLVALLLLFRPETAVRLILPCLAGVFDAPGLEVSSLIHTSLASGTHMSAVAVAFWIATANVRGAPALRGAMALAGTVHAGLFMVFPLLQMFQAGGARCATSSILVAFVPLFACWLLYDIVEAIRARHSAGGRPATYPSTSSVEAKP